MTKNVADAVEALKRARLVPARLVALGTWTVRGVQATDGYYGCDSGCEYYRILAIGDGGHGVELAGDFGAVDDDVVESAREIADAIGVPLVVRKLLDE